MKTLINWLVAGVVAIAWSPASAQSLQSPLPSITTEIDRDSGPIGALSVLPPGTPIYSDTVKGPQSPWIRLQFGEQTFLGSPADPDAGAVLLITSTLDGATQMLDAASILEWRHTSAYFNGHELELALLAPPDAGPFRVSLSSVITADPADTMPSICGGTDDRVLSQDPRVGRILPAVCTGWTINDCNRCMLTAGHCQAPGLEVLQFNVPLSDRVGQMMMPPPEDQYAIDPDSIQGNGGNGTGNDWAYFGCFPNSNTGLTPAEAQEAWFTLITAPPMGEITIGARVTGFGQATPDLPDEWNFTQTTHIGPILGFNGNVVSHGVDTTPGDSGSPVFDENSGKAYAIHTTGGCNDSGANAGTAVWHPDVEWAILHATGVCEPAQLKITAPFGLPEVISSEKQTQILLTVSPADGLQPVNGATKLVVSTNGTSFQLIDTMLLSPELGAVKVTFPTNLSCGEQLHYFFLAEATDGSITYFPQGAPAVTAVATVAGEVDSLADFDFEDAEGWTVESGPGLTDGEWEVGVPVADGGNAPTSDYDGSGQCFLTDNTPWGSGTSDVDGGPTSLISPIIDLTQTTDPVLSYARWFNNDDLDADRLDVEVSWNDGDTWKLLESVGHTPGWQIATFHLRDFIPPTPLVRVRFTVSDTPNTSKTEAAIDRFRVEEFPCPCVADFNGDGVVNDLDIGAFRTALLDEDPAADFDGDGAFSILDFLLFLEAFEAGCD